MAWVLGLWAVVMVVPFVARAGAARLWLRSFEARRVTDLLAYSWAWACFGAPLGWCVVAWLNWRMLVWLLDGTAGRAGPSFGWLPFWVVVMCWLSPYFLLCLGFDWWLAHRLLQPRGVVEGRKVALWAWVVNVICAASLAGVISLLLWMLRDLHFS